MYVRHYSRFPVKHKVYLQLHIEMREAPLTDFKIIDALIFLTDVYKLLYLYMKYYKIFSFCGFIFLLFDSKQQNQRTNCRNVQYSLSYIYIYIYIYLLYNFHTRGRTFQRCSLYVYICSLKMYYSYASIFLMHL